MFPSIQIAILILLFLIAFSDPENTPAAPDISYPENMSGDPENTPTAPDISAMAASGVDLTVEDEVRLSTSVGNTRSLTRAMEINSEKKSFFSRLVDL